MLTESPLRSSSSVLAEMPTTTYSDMKRQGWRSVLSSVRRDGRLLVTSHNVPEAVILPPEQYDRLIRAAEKTADTNHDLEALRLRFRQRLETLQEAGISEKMETLMGSGFKLDGAVLAGESY